MTTITPWALIVAMVAACLLGAVVCWAAMHIGQVHRETAEFVDELADLDRPRPEDFPIAPRYDEPATIITALHPGGRPGHPGRFGEAPAAGCACGEPDYPNTVHTPGHCTTSHVCQPVPARVMPDITGLAFPMLLAGAAIRQAGLDAGMERVRADDDTAGWRYDRATGALIAPEHTRYFDWPELSEEFRPIPAPIPPDQ